MKFSFIEAFDIPDAWVQVIEEIYNNGEEFRVERGSETTLTKKTCLALRITNPETRPLRHDLAPFDDKFIESYALRYLFLCDKQPGETYTYGERMRYPEDQIQKVINRYKECKGDRQNTIVLRLPQDIDNPEPPCLTVLDTEISNNKLNFILYWRSWDAYGGFPANLSGLQLLKEYMAEEIGVEPGETIAFAKNIHIYERTFELAEKLIKTKTERRKININREADLK